MTIPSPSLSDMLAFVGRAVKTRTTMPVLQCVLIYAVDGRMHVKSTSLEIFLSASAQCEGDLNPVCVLHSTLSALVSGDKTVMELEGETLIVGQGDDTARLPTMKGEDFPAIPNEDMVKIDCNGKQLALAMESVEHCASIDQGRPQMMTVRVRKGEAVATDGRRIAIASFDCSTEFDVMITPPVKPLTETLNRQADFFVGPNWVSAKSDCYEIRVKRSDLQPVNVDAAIAVVKNHKLVCKVNRDLLSGIIGLLRNFTTDKFTAIRFDFDAAGFVLSAQSERGSTKRRINATIGHVIDGAVAFPPTQLIAALGVMGDELEILMIDRLSPIVLRSGTRSEIICPMLVKE